MTEKRDALLEGVDLSTLTPVVRRALGSETAEVLDWQAASIDGGAGRQGVYRVAGHARNGTQTLPWSVILKVIRPSTGMGDPSHPDYWVREPLAYQSGFLDHLSGPLRAPRCYGVDENPGLEYRLWLEDASEAFGTPWSLQRYGEVARRLGQFNGAYLTGAPLPSESWMSQGWLRAWLVERAADVAALGENLEHPLVHRLYPGDLPDRTFRLWAERELFLQALDRLPQTFCHMDAFRRNLFTRHSATGILETVAVDWTKAGIGAVGEEIAPLVTASVFFLEVDVAHLHELDEIAFEAYVTGLREAGWRGEVRMVRFGYTAASALRFGLGITLIINVLLDETRHAWAEQVLGCPMMEAIDIWAELTHFLHDLGDEARELLDHVR